MKKATNEAMARGKAAMEDEAMKEVLYQSPDWKTGRVRHHRDPRMRRAQSKKVDDE